MITMDVRVPNFTSVLVLDLNEEDVQSALETVTRRAETRATNAPGFVSTTVLRRTAQLGGITTAPCLARVLEYTQWNSEPDFERCNRVEDIPSAPGPTIGYRLDAVITSAPRMTISAADSRHTLIVMMTPKPGEKTFINDYNQAETADYFGPFDGFVGAAFHLSAGDAILEYLQWESPEQMGKALSTDHFRAHVVTNEEHCSSVDTGAYAIVSTILASTGAQSASPAERRTHA